MGVCLPSVLRTAGAFFTTALAVLHHLPQADSSPCPTGILHHGVSRSHPSSIPRAQRAEFWAPWGRHKIVKKKNSRNLYGSPFLLFLAYFCVSSLYLSKRNATRSASSLNLRPYAFSTAASSLRWESVNSSGIKLGSYKSAKVLSGYKARASSTA